MTDQELNETINWLKENIYNLHHQVDDVRRVEQPCTASHIQQMRRELDTRIDACVLDLRRLAERVDACSDDLEKKGARLMALEAATHNATNQPGNFQQPTGTEVANARRIIDEHCVDLRRAFEAGKRSEQFNSDNPNEATYWRNQGFQEAVEHFKEELLRQQEGKAYDLLILNRAYVESLARTVLDEGGFRRKVLKEHDNLSYFPGWPGRRGAVALPDFVVLPHALGRSTLLSSPV